MSPRERVQTTATITAEQAGMGFAQKVAREYVNIPETDNTYAQPAEAGDGVKPGVERSATPGSGSRDSIARGAGDGSI